MGFFDKFISTYREGYDQKRQESRRQEDFEHQLQLNMMEARIKELQGDDTLDDDARNREIHHIYNQMGDLTGYKHDPKIFGLFAPRGHASTMKGAKLGDVIFGHGVEEYGTQAQKRQASLDALDMPATSGAVPLGGTPIGGPTPTPVAQLPVDSYAMNERLPDGRTVYEAVNGAMQGGLPPPPGAPAPNAAQTAQTTGTQAGAAQGGLPPPPDAATQTQTQPSQFPNTRAGRRARIALEAKRQELQMEMEFKIEEAKRAGFSQPVGPPTWDESGEGHQSYRNPVSGEQTTISFGKGNPAGVLSANARATAAINKPIEQRVAELMASNPDMTREQALQAAGVQMQKERVAKYNESLARKDRLDAEAGLTRTKDHFLKLYNGGGPLTETMRERLLMGIDESEVRIANLLENGGLDTIPPRVQARSKQLAQTRVAQEMGGDQRESIIKGYEQKYTEEIFRERNIDPKLIESAQKDPTLFEAKAVNDARAEARRRAEQRYKEDMQALEERYTNDEVEKALSSRSERAKQRAASASGGLPAPPSSGGGGAQTQSTPSTPSNVNSIIQRIRQRNQTQPQQ